MMILPKQRQRYSKGVKKCNPFHNGHKYQIQATRQAGAEGIVAVMSGDCVQRGSAAVFSKYDRAQAAIRNGADLVIELPCPFSCSNSEVFARSANDDSAIFLT